MGVSGNSPWASRECRGKTSKRGMAWVKGLAPNSGLGGAPVGMLEQFFPTNVPWGGALPHVHTRRVRVELPGFGYAFVSPDKFTKKVSFDSNVLSRHTFTVTV